MSGVRFIRVNGRIVPIKDKGSNAAYKKDKAISRAGQSMHKYLAADDAGKIKTKLKFGVGSALGGFVGATIGSLGGKKGTLIGGAVGAGLGSIRRRFELNAKGRKLRSQMRKDVRAARKLGAHMDQIGEATANYGRFHAARKNKSGV